jgi:hypothetical protein
VARGDWRGRLPTRESLDSAGDEELRAELRQRLPPPGGRSTAPPARLDAADRSGSVTVVVDARGHVADVGISPGWRDRLDGQEFAAAVFEAYTAARQQAVEASALATLAAEGTGGDARGPHLHAARPEPRWHPGPAPRPPTDPADWLAWIHEQFHEARAEVERSLSSATQERHHVGARGLLAATLRGQDVLGVTGDARRISEADTGQLRDDAFDVLTAAHRADAD